MPLIARSIKDKLTKKQQQALRTDGTIIHAFYDGQEKKHRSQSELKSLTNLSAGAVSKHLRELIRQGVVREVVILNEKNSERIVYEYTEKPFRIQGKLKPSLETAAQIHKVGGETYMSIGYLKKGRPTVKDTTQRKEFYFKQSSGWVKLRRERKGKKREPKLKR